MEAIVLGCTELSLLIKQKDVDIFLLDTNLVHAKAVAKYSLN